MCLKDIRSVHNSILNGSEENHVFVKSATLQRFIARHQRVSMDSRNQQAQYAATTTTTTTTKLRFLLTMLLPQQNAVKSIFHTI